LTSGGNYDFKHTTLANFWNYSVRNTPTLFLNNYTTDTLDNPVAIPFNLNIANSIIYGYNIDEIETDMDGGADSLYYFNHCLIKTSLNTSNDINYNSIIKNEDPLFVNASENDYRIDSLSPAIGFGNVNIANDVPFDLDGISRLPLPDLGVYQFVPGQEENK
ncbi:MAG: hypothetical protein C0598_13690, partial [Marinilabiliales bacterium]